MKVKNFQTYLEKRIGKNEIAKIEQQALLEKIALESMQNDISNAITTYMTQENIGFNELVRRLGTSPSQVVKMQKGTANLTLASLAHLFALIKKQPHIIFKSA